MDKGEGHILLDLGFNHEGVNPVVGEITYDNVLNNEDAISNIEEALKGKIYGKVNISNVEDNKYLFEPVVGEIICDNVLNNEDVISNIEEALKNKIHGNVNIKNIEDNKYLFECDSDQTALEVIRGGPWIIMGHFLSLEYWESDCPLKEIPLTDVRVWVQVHGLQQGDLSDDGSTETHIGDHIGKFIEADPKNHRHIVKYGFIRVKVFLNCYEVIKLGMFIYEGRNEKYRIGFKFENLAEMCYNCGHFGHSKGSCRADLDHTPHPQLGPWLRAKPIRFKKDEYLIEECIEITITTLVFIILGYLCWKLFWFILSL